MQWIITQIRSLHSFVARPEILLLLLVSDLAGYFFGLLLWYGPVLAEPSTPLWAWPFIPDCPFYGLLGGLGLMMVTAHKYWRPQAIAKAQRGLLITGGISVLLWLSTYLPSVPTGWANQGAMLGLWSWTLLLYGALFQRSPSWLLAISVLGNIKFGIWTVTYWGLFWQSTAAVYGEPILNLVSISMTLTHIGMVVQGLFLMTYFKPSRIAAFTALGWFILNDYVDYGLGFHPNIIEPWVSRPVLQWSTIAITLLISGWFYWLSLQDEPRKSSRASDGLDGPIDDNRSARLMPSS